MIRLFLKEIYKFDNERGVSLLGLLAAVAISTTVIYGLVKTVSNFSDQTAALAHREIVNEIQNNVRTMLVSQNAWNSSRNRIEQRGGAPGAAGCYPGGTISGTDCYYDFYYNESTPEILNDFDKLTGEGGHLKQWICSHVDASGDQAEGTGILSSDGKPVYPQDLANGINDCCLPNATNAGANFYETCVLGKMPTLTDYVVVKVLKPASASPDAGIPGNFNIEIHDKARLSGSGKIYTMTLYAGAGVPNPTYIPGQTSGPCSVAVGLDSSAMGQCSVALGWQADASGDYSFAAGTDAVATQQNRFQFGGTTGPYFVVVGEPDQEPTGWAGGNSLIDFTRIGGGGGQPAAGMLVVRQLFGNKLIAANHSGNPTCVPDYVFDKYFDGVLSPEDRERFKDYYIYTIPEMVDFIEEYRHLPTIPGRAELEEGSPVSLNKHAKHIWETLEVQSLYAIELYEKGLEREYENEKLKEDLSALKADTDRINEERERFKLAADRLYENNIAIKERNEEIEKKIAELEERLNRLENN